VPRIEGIYSASKGGIELVTEAYEMEIKGLELTLQNLAPGDFATI